MYGHSSRRTPQDPRLPDFTTPLVQHYIPQPTTEPPLSQYAHLGMKYSSPIKKSMSFLGASELLSYKIIPLFGACAYLGSSLGAIATEETFVNWFGSEYTAVNVLTGLTAGSWIGLGCYIYGRRHIRHAGAFQKVIYPTFTSTLFIAASHFSWAFIKNMMAEQNSFDYHWRCLTGLASGVLFMYIGKSYLLFIDHW